MSSSRLHRWSKKLLHAYDKVLKLVGLKRRKPVMVDSYRGFGSRNYLFLSGRVLRDRLIRKDARDTTWKNLTNTVKRFNSREIGGAKICVRFGGYEFYLTTDAEGYYTLDTHLERPLPPPPDHPPYWQKARIELLSIPGRPTSYEQKAEILIPGSAASFGIISDIDDTILKTYVTSWLKWRMLYLTILKNAFSRQAFSRVAAFYQALRRGADEEHYNPFFYVSNSPWNLYDLLEEFLDLNQLPRGPIMLRDFGLPYNKRPLHYRGHKHEQIIRILELYPQLPFVLIGDSGEKDTDIYHAVATEYPGRIKAIYIRDVRSTQRAQRVQNLLSSLHHTPTLLVRSYEDAARHAAELQLLSLPLFEKFNPLVEL
jgi:phosphatidate phosphatase APP1